MARLGELAGVWRTTDEGQKIFIADSGEVRAGGPDGPVVGTDDGRVQRTPEETQRSFKAKMDFEGFFAERQALYKKDAADLRKRFLASQSRADEKWRKTGEASSQAYIDWSDASEKEVRAHFRAKAAKSRLDDFLASPKGDTDEARSDWQAQADALKSRWQEADRAHTEARMAELDAQSKYSVASAEHLKSASARDQQGSRLQKFLRKEGERLNSEDGHAAWKAEHRRQSAELGRNLAKSMDTAESAEQRQLGRIALAEGTTFLADVANPVVHSRGLGVWATYEEGVRANYKGPCYLRGERLEEEIYYRVIRDDGAIGVYAPQVTLSGNDPAHVVVHEYGHALEATNTEVSRLCTGFLRQRTKGETPESIRDVTGWQHFSPNERGMKDEFDRAWTEVLYDDKVTGQAYAYYTGKVYSANAKVIGGYGSTPAVQLGATEVLSMGMEMLYRNPVAFAKADPEYFDFVTSVLTGRALSGSRARERASL